MNIVIRVDASKRMGTGHLIRCLTLAKNLRGHGAQVTFVCRAHPGHLIDSLHADGFEVSILPEPPGAREESLVASAEDYAQWLGVPQAQDAAETLAALCVQSGSGSHEPPAAKVRAAVCDNRTDWLIVDHYGLDAKWEQALRPHVGRMLVIDDLANRKHDCDLLLDQNYAEDAETRYDGLLPANTRTLMGPYYALLRPEYRDYRQTLQRRGDGLRRVLVFFGGIDPENLTGRALGALCDAMLAHLEVDLVVGANNPHRDAIASQAAMRPGTKLYPPRPHLADLMAEADLCIGAGGATTWERCCLGLPSIVVSIADNQRPACTVLSTDGLICYLGHRNAVSASMLRDAIVQLSQDPKRLSELSIAGSRAVDGGGAERVAAALLEIT